MHEREVAVEFSEGDAGLVGYCGAPEGMEVG